jgi:glycerophosphoryl diester phosphodiesterase
MIPEIKQPIFHNSVFNETENFMESEVLSTLRINGYPILAEDVPQCTYQSEPIQCGPIIFQSFDKDSLKYFSKKVNHTSIELMMVIHPDIYLLTPNGFQEIAAFSNYVCLWKEYMYLEVEAEIEFKGMVVLDEATFRTD